MTCAFQICKLCPEIIFKKLICWKKATECDITKLYVIYFFILPMKDNVNTKLENCKMKADI